MNALLMLISGFGFTASAWAHGMALAQAEIPGGSRVLWFQLGIFVVWVPAIILQYRMARDNTGHETDQNLWMDYPPGCESHNIYSSSTLPSISSPPMYLRAGTGSILGLTIRRCQPSFKFNPARGCHFTSRHLRYSIQVFAGSVGQPHTKLIQKPTIKAPSFRNYISLSTPTWNDLATKSHLRMAFFAHLRIFSIALPLASSSMSLSI